MVCPVPLPRRAGGDTGDGEGDLGTLLEEEGGGGAGDLAEGRESHESIGACGVGGLRSVDSATGFGGQLIAARGRIANARPG